MSEIKHKSDMHIIMQTEEDWDIYTLDHIELQIFNKNIQLNLEEEGKESFVTPDAEISIKRIIGGPSMILDSADSQNEDFFRITSAIWGNILNENETAEENSECLAALLKIPSGTLETVDNCFYIDNIKVNNMSEEELPIVISSAIQTVTKGLSADSWIVTTYASQTIDENSLVEGFDFKSVGFKTIPKMFAESIEGNKVMAVTEETLKVKFNNKAKSNKLKNN